MYTIMMPTELRQFFAWFVICDNFVYSCEIWFKLKEYFCEGSLDNHKNRALQEINKIFKSENMRCSDFGLPEPDNDLQIKTKLENEKKEMVFHENISKNIIAELNVDQKMIFDYITTKEKDSECMFLSMALEVQETHFFIKL